MHGKSGIQASATVELSFADWLADHNDGQLRVLREWSFNVDNAMYGLYANVCMVKGEERMLCNMPGMQTRVIVRWGV